MARKLPNGRLEQRFDEWKPPYSQAEAIAEANRCIYCNDAPCITACPTSIEIPTFIKKIASENVVGAAKTILDANLLGYSCARVCPVEVLCVGACVYSNWGRAPIQIGKLQRFAVETAWGHGARGLFPSQQPPSGRRVALVGAGPASIVTAAHLALAGHHCVIFDRKPEPGGLNTHGIAPYKMKADDALAEIDWVASLELVEFKLATAVVETVTGPNQVAAGQLLRDYDAVLLGIGIGGDSMLGIEGEGAADEDDGVVGATWWIEQIKGNPGYALGAQVRRVIVVGAGNTALDAAHELRLLGVPDVAMVYRRSEQEMSGYAHELAAARKDGVRLIENRVPLGIVREAGRVVALRVAEAQKGRAVAGTESTIPADLVIIATGQDRKGHTAMVRWFGGVQTDARGCVVVDPATQRTENPKVWAAGDCVNGGKEVVNAVAEAKIAVRDILTTLSEQEQ